MNVEPHSASVKKGCYYFVGDYDRISALRAVKLIAVSAAYLLIQFIYSFRHSASYCTVRLYQTDETSIIPWWRETAGTTVQYRFMSLALH